MIASRSSSGIFDRAHHGLFQLLAHQFALGRVVVAQAHAGSELLGIVDVDVVRGRTAVVRDQVVFCGVHGNPVQPRIELRVATEIADRPVRAQEGFLRHVLALAPVGE